MERLTESNPSWIDDELWESACEPDCEEIDAVYRKLKDYEDLDEQGRLIKLPCKYVWFIADKNSPEYAIVMGKPITDISIYEVFNIDKNNCKYYSTRDAAEAKLKELRGVENDNS